MVRGLAACGIRSRVTAEKGRRQEGFPILLGTTFWKGIENDGGEYLLVDCRQFGTQKYVTLGWNGHGRDADYKIPDEVDGSRWEAHGIDLKPWQTGPHTVLCGQLPHPYEWYDSVEPRCDVFRGHPADKSNPTHLPGIATWEGVGRAVVLSSTVAVDAVINGVPTITMDPRSMAWDVTSHTFDYEWTGDRLPWLHRLAWCQWHHDEIEKGIPHLWA